ncbi:hypothetical protein DERP_014113 [Dermatophagoides pteronyssinus]|uniref:Uncharacterized protein n=1 Tax=Dermatophagoides pteronyssinus TaxID=6956 RepID=A0ABQ8IXA5_DERPT|nr:hypothetical protein DERP_014113 [Dermatophagoides pteronyssinus]
MNQLYYWDGDTFRIFIDPSILIIMLIHCLSRTPFRENTNHNKLVSKYNDLQSTVTAEKKFIFHFDTK